MKFKYKELKGRFRPIIPIKIKSGEWISYDAYVDSGAGRSVFHSFVTDDLEIKLEDGKKVYVTVGDGSQIIVYIHKLSVEIAEQKFMANIGFSRNLGTGFNIIGRADIFNRFRICFDEKERLVDFQPK